jgi:hypothetical protein
MGKDTKILSRYLTVDSLIQWLSSPAAKRYLIILIVIGVLLASVLLGLRASMRWLLLLGMGGGALVLLYVPQLGLLAVIAAALMVRFEISTGTEVWLNVATLLIPVLFGLWLFEGLRRHKLRWATSSVNKPLILFLLASLLSFVIGNVTWDPAVPKSGNFWLVQLAQWAIFAFAAFAFWLVANIQGAATWLPRLTWFFLILGGGLAILYVLSRLFGALTVNFLLDRVTTFTIQRTPFWMLLAAISAGQLLFNQRLSAGRRLFLLAIIAVVLLYVFYLERATASNWVAVVAVAGVLAWLRWPQMRQLAIVLLVVLAITGVLSSAVYDFAGGDAEWEESGGSRLVLIGRVIEVTMRNPFTGLGPAAYRPYANVAPLQYQGALWWNPQINSHNNYVDLFAHTGLLGLGLFFWFAIKLWLLGWRLNSRYRTGFIGGYVGGLTAAWVGSLVLMLLADWIFPFVYNIGFRGFQASVMVWLFLGGLVAIDHMDDIEKC